MNVFHFTNWIPKDPVWLVVLLGIISLVIKFIGVENIKNRIRTMRSQWSKPHLRRNISRLWAIVWQSVLKKLGLISGSIKWTETTCNSRFREKSTYYWIGRKWIEDARYEWWEDPNPDPNRHWLFDDSYE